MPPAVARPGAGAEPPVGEALEQLISSEQVEGRPLPLDPAARTALIAMADRRRPLVLNLRGSRSSRWGPAQPLDPEGLPNWFSAGPAL